MAIKYPHLLSPCKIGNHVFKNRLIAACSSVQHEQGPEPYPNDAIFTDYLTKAKSGASLIIFGQGGTLEYQSQDMSPEKRREVLEFRESNPNPFNPEFGWDPSGVDRFPNFDLVDGRHQHYLCTLTEAIHFYGAKCMMKSGAQQMPKGYDICEGNAPKDTEGAMHHRSYKKVLTQEMLRDIVDQTALRCCLMKECGFDGVYFHLAYRGSAPARMLSPITNRRTDQYGGSPENRVRYAIEMADAIKKKCGQDFIIYACFSPYEEEGGYTLEEGIEYARLLTGHIDMLELRGPDNEHSMTTNYMLERYPFLEAAAAYKKGAPGMGIVATGGFQNFEDEEEVIASGKADFISAARAWICNPDYGQLAYEGRNDDIVPCLKCNGCHLMSYYKPWNSYCAVNPIWGLGHKIGDMVDAVKETKRVAVIGGGPAGIKAALVASQRGHTVTLFEKTDHLGGHIKTIENAVYKWPHKDYVAYLNHQIGKSAVDIHMNTEATPEMIREQGFDSVIVAIGSDPVIPDIPGIHGENVILVTELYGQEDQMGQDVVVIGGGESGVEAGMHLAGLGKTVTVLEMSGKLAKKSVPIHYYTNFREAWNSLPTFRGIEHACVTAVQSGHVTYVDADGREQTVNADHVILAAGITPRADEAMKFYGSADRYVTAGDCKSVGGLQHAIRSAYAAAVTI